MLATSTSLRHPSLCIASKTLLTLCRRSFRTSLIRFAGGGEVTPTASKRSVRKKLAELPTAYTLPDGTQATPLAEFKGGMEMMPGALPRKRTIKSKPAASDSAADSVKPVRKRRVKHSERSMPEDILDNALSPEVACSTPTNTEGSVSKPRNQLAREILDNLERYPHCILLTRVGQFYESYFEQAVEIASLLSIKLTTRKWDGRRIHMCGFPLMHLDKHLKTLVQQNKRFVAMCEEFPRIGNPTQGGNQFDRRVVRIITPGTLVDESFLNPYENNYLLAIHCDANLEVQKVETEPDTITSYPIGLAWIDVSTGEFISKLSSLDNLRDDIERVDPREVVLESQLRDLPYHSIRRLLDAGGYLVSYLEPDVDVEVIPPSLDVQSIQEDAAPSVASDDITEPASRSAFSPLESSAFSIITSYLRSNLLENMPSLSFPRREGLDGRMRIDAHTIKALEIRESMREGGVQGSLLSTVRRTVTSSGSRLLARWLCSPSTSRQEIDARQSLVAFFHIRPHLRDTLRPALGNIDDASRIVQKFLLGRGDASDLLAISTTIKAWASIGKLIQDERCHEANEVPNFTSDDWTSIDNLTNRLINLDYLSDLIDRAFNGNIDANKDPDDDNEGEDENNTEMDSARSSQMKSGWRFGLDKWVVNPAFSDKLFSLHEELKDCLQRREELELDLRRRYNTPSLTLRTSPAYGMHVHLGKKREQSGLNKSDLFISIAESGSTKCYFNQAWSQLGGRIVEVAHLVEVAEREACESLRNEVTSEVAQLRRNARIMDELDVTLGFAVLAEEMNFVRPEVTDCYSFKVVNGRHPTVELGLLTSGKVFTPNTTDITPSSRLHIITGPNMAGKSTLLRQTALISILAQIGSFVPADSASVGIVDQLFSRIGAKDDLFHGQSTFMVEMSETAEILRRATPRSLVIMDEVGRGTTVRDGLAIAFATVQYLLSVNQCRVLFATHFHELADMLGYSETSDEYRGQGSFKEVAFYHTDIDDIGDGRFAYSYRVRPGVNRNSHGLKVAQLAGLPPVALDVAKRTLERLKSADV